MGVMCIDRNTTAVDILQVAINYYSFDLALRNVRGQIASMFFKGVHLLSLSHNISKADRNC